MAERSMVRRSARCIIDAVRRLAVRVEIGLRGLPVAPVEPLDGKLNRLIEAICVDAPRVRGGAGLIEALHPASAAEQMLRRPGAEAVVSKYVAAGQQLETLSRHPQREKA